MCIKISVFQSEWEVFPWSIIFVFREEDAWMNSWLNFNVDEDDDEEHVCVCSSFCRRVISVPRKITGMYA